MEIRTLKIAGMSCQHCVMHVKKELSKIATVKDVQIGMAVIELDPAAVSDDLLKRSVSDAGYQVVSIS
jgi:copper chaperone